MKETLSLADRYAGCIIGQAVGDALGFIVEGQDAANCQSYLNSIVRPKLLHRVSRGPFNFGQYSDDTQLSRELMQSFVSMSRFDLNDYGRRIAAIFTEERIVGRGRATQNAALRLASGASPKESGEPAPSAGNGSAMRAAAAALLSPKDRNQVISIAALQGEATHKDPRATAGAVTIALTAWHSLQDQAWSPSALINDLIEACKPISAEFAQSLTKMPHWLTLDLDQALALIAPQGKDPSYKEPWPGISPFVTGSVLWSLYCFLKHPDDFTAAVFDSIAVGGDVDTTAAMTGALSGCHVGLDKIPKEWSEAVNDQGTWTYEDLVNLAHECLKLARSS